MGALQITTEGRASATRQIFPTLLSGGTIFRGWARSACGDAAEGLAWIEGAIEDWMATSTILWVSYYLALKAEALYLADRTCEALGAINEAEELAERFEDRHWCAELRRLRAVYFSRRSVQKRTKLRLRSAQPLESQRSRSRFR